jgi:hypothetical protein
VDAFRLATVDGGRLVGHKMQQGVEQHGRKGVVENDPAAHGAFLRLHEGRRPAERQVEAARRLAADTEVSRTMLDEIESQIVERGSRAGLEFQFDLADRLARLTGDNAAFIDCQFYRGIGQVELAGATPDLTRKHRFERGRADGVQNGLRQF